MNELTKFLRYNNLKQKELADYLGIAEGSVSKMLNGTIGYKKHLGKILSNTEGWDTSMLIENNSPTITAKATNNSTAKVSIDNSVKTVADIPPDVALLKAQIDSLTEQINLLKAELQRMRDEKDKYWEMIDRLTKK